MLSYDDFADHVGSQFTVIDDGGASVGLILEEARLAPALSADVKAAVTRKSFRTPFSLIFLAAADQILPQRTYDMCHPALGARAIFLVPIAKTLRGVSYEAAFG